MLLFCLFPVKFIIGSWGFLPDRPALFGKLSVPGRAACLAMRPHFGRCGRNVFRAKERFGWLAYLGGGRFD
jgi:hypothetical protein